MKANISLDDLIKIVNNGGTVTTGVDIYNKHSVLLLEQDIVVSNVNILYNLKRNGVRNLLINPRNAGGVWDSEGNIIDVEIEEQPEEKPENHRSLPDLEKKINEIKEIKKAAKERYHIAKTSIKKVITDIKKTGGEFDYNAVEETTSNLLDFLTENDNAFSYLTKEIFTYDDYLYNHSINVCTIGFAILNRFNRHFSKFISSNLKSLGVVKTDTLADSSFTYFFEEDLKSIAIGYFLHDIGKVMITDKILNKKGKLSEEEFKVVREHSYIKGVQLIEKNNLKSPYIENIVGYHHASLFDNEKGCYPDSKSPSEVPIYVKICKLADIYDAMTSKRSYKEAVNPIGVVTELFRKYANRDSLLQYILHSFVKSIGIYPPGSIAYLTNGQRVFILDSEGPIVIPITDQYENLLTEKSDPLNLTDFLVGETKLALDNTKPLVSPAEAYDSLPSFLKDLVL